MSKRHLLPLAGGLALAVLTVGVSAMASDWRIAVPTGAGLGIVDPNTPGAQSVKLSGSEFGQIDEVISVSGGARALASISAVGGGSESILAFDTRTGMPVGTTSFGGAMFGIITDMTVPLSDGASVAIVALDGNVNILDVASGKATVKPLALECSPLGAALTPDGASLVVGKRVDGDSDTQLSIDVVGLNPLAVSKSVALGKQAVTGDETKYRFQLAGNTGIVFGGTVAYFADLTTGKVKKLAPVYNKKALTPIGASTDGKTLLCRYGDGALGVFVCDVATGKVTKNIMMRDPAFAIGSADGALIYVSSPEKATIGVFDASTMAVKASFPVDGLTGPIRILPDPAKSVLPVPKQIGGNVVVYADAFLGGMGDGKDTFATLLQRKLAADGYGIPVVNSLNDSPAQSLADGYDDNVKGYAPKLVVLELGQNDLVAAASDADGALEDGATKDMKLAAEAKAQTDAVPAASKAIDAAVAKAVASGVPTILVAPASDLLRPAYDAAAAKYAVPLISGSKALKDAVDLAYPAITGAIAKLVPATK